MLLAELTVEPSTKGGNTVKTWAVLGTIGLLLLGVAVPRADAGIGGSNTPTWPGTAQVGSTINTSVTVLNTSTSPNDTENVRLVNLFVTPACASTSSPGVCLSPNLDPGVFTVLSAQGDAATAPCAGLTFTISVSNAGSGEVQLTPSSNITLGPASGPLANRTCKVNLSLHVDKVPTNPAGGIAGKTDPLSRTALLGLSSQLNGTASGSAEIIVTAEPPPPPPPPPQPPPPPINQIPTLSEWVMIMLAGFIVLVGAIAVRRRTT
jgi:hypothetical protein